MEHQKTTNLSGNISDKVPKFITKKWIAVHDQSDQSSHDQSIHTVLTNK